MVGVSKKEFTTVNVFSFLDLALAQQIGILFGAYYFIKLQQTHQRNQIKDSIDVDEPEGMWVFSRLIL